MWKADCAGSRRPAPTGPAPVGRRGGTTTALHRSERRWAALFITPVTLGFALFAVVTVALAADCNPGTSYTTSIPFCIALAVREMGMTPDEAVWAATAGGARALRRDDVGRLSPGARADAVLLDAPSHLHLAYRPGVALAAGEDARGVPVDDRFRNRAEPERRNPDAAARSETVVDPAGRVVIGAEIVREGRAGGG